MRITYSHPEGMSISVTLMDSSPLGNIIGEADNPYESMAEIPLDFTDTGDIVLLNFNWRYYWDPPAEITNIEFYEE